MTQRSRFCRSAALGAGILTSLLLATGAVRGDDRELLGSSSADPYVMMMLDTSGSMNSTTPCSRENAINDDDPFDVMCTSLCPFEDPPLALPAGTSPTCARVCPDVGCEEYDFSVVGRPTFEPTIIRDDTDAPNVDAWTIGTTFTDYHGSSYFHDNDLRCGEFGDITGCKEITYDPNLAAGDEGDYMVFLWWPVDPGAASDPAGVGNRSASNTLVRIEHYGGTAELAVDQRIEGGQWNPIGTWSMSAGGGQVTISNEHAQKFGLFAPSGIAIADAVGWRKVTIPACVGDEVYRCQQPVCPLGDCYAPLNGDDPSSKLFQAKQGIYEVVDQISDAQFGFATFEQDELRLEWKHWLYRVVGGTIPQLKEDILLPAGSDFIEAGDDEVFGVASDDGFGCQKGSNAGCVGTDPADLTDPWELTRARRIPKLGKDGDDTTEVWYRVGRDDNQTYKVVYNPNSNATVLGADIVAVEVEVYDCDNGICGASCGNGICEAGDGENCGTCPADCNRKLSGGGRFCCGFDDGVDDTRAPDGCGLAACVTSPWQCTETPVVPELVDTGTVNYRLVSDFSAFERGGLTTREPQTGSGFFAGEQNIEILNTVANKEGCFGIEGNELSDVIDDADEVADEFEDYSLHWTTVGDARGDAFTPRIDVFDVGDFVPFDWETSARNADVILERMAPNTVNGGSPPDFRTAVYFNDTIDPMDNDSESTRLLRLADSTERPILARGETPLGEAMKELLDWYDDPAVVYDETDSTTASWADIARLEDTQFECRDKYLVLLTDGADTCVDEPQGFADPGDAALGLFNFGIETFPVAFGVPNVAAAPDVAASLNAIAAAGGHDLVTAQNKDELVDALLDIFGEIEVSSRAFASASIPAIQSSAADKIFLSSFAPLPDVGFWPGRVDAFRSPLPLTSDDQPDVDNKCEDIDTASGDLQSACHIWDAGEELCGQAPDTADRANIDTRTVFQLGTDPAAERRVIYGLEPAGAQPNSLRLFDIPTLPTVMGAALDPLLEDLLEAADPDQLAAWNGSGLTVAELTDFVYDLFEGTYLLKDVDPAIAEDVEACDLDSDGVSDAYILGDVFHANPVSFGSPVNFRFFADNLEGYRDFARKHAWRRKMLVAATNDGQLHFFDAGVRQFVLNDFTENDLTDRIEVFNDGSGHELFSYIPRFALPILNQQIEGEEHIFSLDSTPIIADVFIDPTDDFSDDTQWRTVLIGGMREAGDIKDSNADAEYAKGGYYALDLTEPDVTNPRLDLSDPTHVPCDGNQRSCNDTTPTFPSEWLPSCLDFTSDSDGFATTPSGCDFPFPMELWTFDDSVVVAGTKYYLDEDKDAMGNPVVGADGHRIADLADTWSRPVVGPILVCSSALALDCDPTDPDHDDDLEVRWVSIFGGGMDPHPDRKGEDEVGGNYLYMVDVETGDVIYKRELTPPAAAGYPNGGSGSAAGDPAVLDVDSDGYLDRIYIGTTDGLLYKVDLTARTAGLVPGFASPAFSIDEEDIVSLSPSGDASSYVGPAVSPPVANRITDPAWDPFPILDAGGPYEGTPRRGSPIYFAPAAFYIPELDQYGLTIGTGDREDLWDPDNGEDVAFGGDPLGARYFVIVDEDISFDASKYSSAASCASQLPITEACLKNFVFDQDLTNDCDPLVDCEEKTNYLLPTDPDDDDVFDSYLGDPGNDGNRRGWAMSFTPDARTTAEPFVVGGILIFSVFDPTIVPDANAACALSGVTRAFVVSATNSGPVAPLGPDDSGPGGSTRPKGERGIDRYHEIAEFTTAPFVDRTATKNPTSDTKTILDEIDDEIADAVRESLVAQYPRGSRFNEAFSLVIAALRNSTGVNVLTTIPIAMYPADWRDQ